MPPKSPDCVDESLLSVAKATDFSKFGPNCDKVKFFKGDFSPSKGRKKQAVGGALIAEGQMAFRYNQITRLTCKRLRQWDIDAIACIQNMRRISGPRVYNCAQHAHWQNPCIRFIIEHLFFNQHLSNLPGRRALMTGLRQCATLAVMLLDSFQVLKPFD
jgi:hypothetical protein